jgi:hypothetical protein
MSDCPSLIAAAVVVPQKRLQLGMAAEPPHFPDIPVGQILVEGQLVGLTLHQWYTADEAVAAFGGDAAAEWSCDGQFVVLPGVVLCLFTLGETTEEPHVSCPSCVVWRPRRLDYEPSGETPRLPEKVREVWDRSQKPVRKLRDRHVFLRTLSNDLPVDSHELVAQCAPRPVFIIAGATKGDGWVDAKGMFLAGAGAGPVYELLGKKDLGTNEFPLMETALIDGDVAFRQHSGGHTPGPNWPTFLTFANRYIKGPPLPAKQLGTEER